MASQLALDFSRFRLRGLEIDGTLKTPRVKAFAAVDVAQPPPPAEGEPPTPLRYTDATKELFEERRLVREPSAIAIPSVDCTFRDLELPFTGADQIDKVIKFEAESHLQLVDIDSVVVAYQMLDSDGRGGSRLLAVACAKDRIRRTLADVNPQNVDPHFADLHLTALFTTLKFTGYFAPAPPPAADQPPDATPESETLLALECDYDVTHLLVARGDQLVGARAIRLGLAGKTVATGDEPGIVSGAAEEPPGVAADATGDAASADDEDEEDFVVVDDVGDEAPALGPGRRVAGDYFERLRREVQRTLFKLGPTGEQVKRLVLLGPLSTSEAFRAHLEQKLRLPVEVAKPFDRIAHSLADEDVLARANAEGAAALGVGLRQLGYDGGSRVDFRQEEVRYARRFDQVKIALSCLAIAAFVLVALGFIERLKQQRVKTDELRIAVGAILAEYEINAENRNLTEQVNKGQLLPAQGAIQAKDDLDKRFRDLSSELGRSGGIARLPSGLDYLNAVFGSIDKALEKIGRIEILSMDLDVGRDRNSLKLKGYVDSTGAVDALMTALRACPAIKKAQEPSTSGAKDGRLEITNLELDLVENYDPRVAANK